MVGSRGPPKLTSAYNRGWTLHKKKRIDALVLPNKLRCWECRKLLKTSLFSEVNQKEIKSAIVAGQINIETLQDVPWRRCRHCTPTQVTELECIMCLKVKGLDGFTKAQRRDPDRARCMECVYDHQAEDPIEGTAKDFYELKKMQEDEEFDDDISNAHEDSEFDESEAGGGVPHELNQENLANHNTSTNEHSSKPSASRQSTNASTASSRPAYAGVSSAKLKAWQAVGCGYGGSTANSTSGARFTGYDGDGNPHQRTRSPSTIASGDEDDGEESDSTTTAERSHNAKAMDEKAFKNATAKFAKLGGQRAQAIAKPTYEGRTVSYDNSDDDDEEDEYFLI
ncbi:hypothetical protein N7G274_000881 [Stereocaulon virgatum]|uniref:Stc1 domain-containing protein n=1 Tax=Stereocaulon virgatum TaxID=373712 RepID=A0ABR4AP25_9LECA